MAASLLRSRSLGGNQTGCSLIYTRRLSGPGLVYTLKNYLLVDTPDQHGLMVYNATELHQLGPYPACPSPGLPD